MQLLFLIWMWMFMKIVHIERRLYYKGDYKGMRDYFTAINWSRLLAHKSVQETWDIFVKHFTYAINRYIPITSKPILGNTKSWIDHNVKSHINSKKVLINTTETPLKKIGKLILLK